MNELVIGAGNLKHKVLFFVQDGKEFKNPTTVDIDPNCNPDILHDLNVFPYPFPDGEYDEIHAYEILEHLGTQGDWKFFFQQFKEFHRVLKTPGHIFITVPLWNGPYAWCDPGHTRVMPLNMFSFLSQKTYEIMVGNSAMADYRHYWDKNFDIIQYEEKEGRLYLVLKKG